MRSSARGKLYIEKNTPAKVEQSDKNNIMSIYLNEICVTILFNMMKFSGEMVPNTSVYFYSLSPFLSLSHSPLSSQQAVQWQISTLFEQNIAASAFFSYRFHQ